MQRKAILFAEYFSWTRFAQFTNWLLSSKVSLILVNQYDRRLRSFAYQFGKLIPRLSGYFLNDY